MSAKRPPGQSRRVADPARVEELRARQRFGTYVAQRRKAKRLTQEELAAQTSLRRATISDIENGKAHPHMVTLYLIANALELEPACLFTRLP